MAEHTLHTLNMPNVPNVPLHGDKTMARALAVAMHALFILLIVFGVSWQKKPPEPVMADLWSSLPPLPQPKAVTPPPEPDEKSESPPKPEPRVSVPMAKVAPVPVPKADIALKDNDKKKKAEPKPEPKPAPKKVDDEAVARERKFIEADKAADAKAAADKAALEKAATAERAAKAAVAARENQKYFNGIRSKVWSRVALPPDLQGNPEAEFLVSLLPGGEVQSVSLRKSSGNPAYDAAVERAIRQAQPFDVPSGEPFQQYFRQIPMAFRPQR